MPEHEVHPLDQLIARLDKAGTRYEIMTLESRSSEVRQIENISPKVKLYLDMLNHGRVPEPRHLQMFFSELWSLLGSWKQAFELYHQEGDIPIDYLRGARTLFGAIRHADPVAILRGLRTQKLVLSEFMNSQPNDKSWFVQALEQARVDPADVLVDALGVPAGYLLVAIELYEASRGNDGQATKEKSLEFNKMLLEARKVNRG